ncbi:CaiB/BaiF CoA transferase family protein [Achromobacter aloeverae]
MTIESSVASSRGALSGVRVIEIAGPAVQYCGKMFADLGAEVILVEPPGGAHTRQTGPFLHTLADAATQPLRSLSFVYLNGGKKSVTLDLQTDEGRAALHRLAAGAQLVIEGGRPGRLAELGCGYEALSALNPALVMTSITPYGQTGPYSAQEAEDLVCMATGGFLYLGGYPDGPPIGAYGNQAYSCGSMFGAVASMLALTHAEATGQGDHVDVSIQECMVLAMENAVQFYELEGTLRRRTAGLQRFAGTGVYECADGHVYMMAGGIGANRFWDRTIDWFKEEGVPDVERLAGDEWRETVYLQTDEAKRIFMEVFGAWARTKTKAYLYAAAQDRHVPAAAVNAVDDLVASPQLASRDYFVEVRQPGWPEDIRMPGAPYRLARTPWALQGPAPLPGQHNAQLLGAAARDLPSSHRPAEEIR